MQDKPPASFVANQISIAISNYMTNWRTKRNGQITHEEYLKNNSRRRHSLVEKPQQMPLIYGTE